MIHSPTGRIAYLYDDELFVHINFASHFLGDVNRSGSLRQTLLHNITCYTPLNDVFTIWPRDNSTDRGIEEEFSFEVPFDAYLEGMGEVVKNNNEPMDYVALETWLNSSADIKPSRYISTRSKKAVKENGKIIPKIDGFPTNRNWESYIFFSLSEIALHCENIGYRIRDSHVLTFLQESLDSELYFHEDDLNEEVAYMDSYAQYLLNAFPYLDESALKESLSGVVFLRKSEIKRSKKAEVNGGSENGQDSEHADQNYQNELLGLDEEEIPDRLYLALSLYKEAWHHLPDNMRPPTKPELETVLKEKGLTKSAQINAIIKVSTPNGVELGGKQNPKLTPWKPLYKRKY